MRSPLLLVLLVVVYLGICEASSDESKLKITQDENKDKIERLVDLQKV
jgi:hypothetical protein